MSRAKELVAAFDVFNGKYRREEVEEALTLQEEITPLLISILDDIAADLPENPAGQARAHYPGSSGVAAELKVTSGRQLKRNDVAVEPFCK
jgi:hypothetical protein